MKHNCKHEDRYEDQSCLFRSVVINGTTRHLAVHNLHGNPGAPEWERVTGEVELDGKIIRVEGKNSMMLYKGAEISPLPEGWSK